MSDDNKPRTPKQALLGELESIKNLLDDSSSGEFNESLSDELLNIPILDDVVPELSSNAQGPGLLDLDNIFGDLDDGIIDEHLTSEQAESDGSLNKSITSTESPHQNQDKPEATQEIEASLQIDHLDADVSFPAFTLDAAPEDYSAQIEEHYNLDNILTPEANMLDSNSLQTEIKKDPIDLALQHNLAECLSDSLDTQEQQPPILDDPLSNQAIDNDTYINDQFSDDSFNESETTDERALFDDSADANSHKELASDFQALAPEPAASPAPTTSNAATPAYDLDLMIQELVDEFIPPIEAALRKRLSECSPAVIVELAKKHLDN